MNYTEGPGMMIDEIHEVARRVATEQIRIENDSILAAMKRSCGKCGVALISETVFSDESEWNSVFRVKVSAAPDLDIPAGSVYSFPSLGAFDKWKERASL